jgi:hypothetical protein
MRTGFSGTLLAKKRSFHDGMQVWFDTMPEPMVVEIDDNALELSFSADPMQGINATNIFAAERQAIQARIGLPRNQIAPAGQTWMIWHKKAEPMSTDIAEDAIRGRVRHRPLSITRSARWTRPGQGPQVVIRKELRRGSGCLCLRLRAAER